MKHKCIMRITFIDMYKIFRILRIYSKCSVNISLEYYSLIGEESKTQKS